MLADKLKPTQRKSALMTAVAIGMLFTLLPVAYDLDTGTFYVISAFADGGEGGDGDGGGGHGGGDGDGGSGGDNDTGTHGGGDKDAAGNSGSNGGGDPLGRAERQRMIGEHMKRAGAHELSAEDEARVLQQGWGQ